MKKAITAFLVFTLLVSIFTGCSLQSEKYVVLSVTDNEGNPIEGIIVCEEKYTIDTESLPISDVNLTNENGELKYSPEEFGEQKLAVGIFYSGKQIEWDYVSVDITEEDANQHTSIHITYNPEE